MPDLDPAQVTTNHRFPRRPDSLQRKHQRLESGGDVPTDVQLMALIGRRDSTALAQLYDRHAGAVFGLTRSILRDPRLAEEATHDIFLHIWQHPHLYEPGRGALVAWLLRVARNRAIDLLRRDREEPFAAAAATDDGAVLDPVARLVDPDAGPEEQALRRLQRDDVLAALDELEPEQRRLLELAYFGGLTQREIAARVNRPLGTVKTQIRTAMQRMAHVLTSRGITSATASRRESLSERPVQQ
jgi:RNA polymerase sigma-70 factor (ECF subfamily)